MGVGKFFEGAGDTIMDIAAGISKTGSGELAGILEGKTLTGLMGQTGDLAGQAARKKIAKEVAGIYAGNVAGREAISKVAGENGLALADKAFKQGSDIFVSGITPAAGSSDEAALTAFKGFMSVDSLKAAAASNKDKAYKEAIESFIDSENGMLTKYQNAVSAGLTGNELYGAVTGKEKLGAIGGAYTYLTDPTYGSGRKKVLLGGAAAGAIGIRYLQGGTLTRKANGENDIAGVPFI